MCVSAFPVWVAFRARSSWYDFCLLRQAYNRPTTRIVSCKSNLQFAFDCLLSQKKCSILKHVSKLCDNGKSCSALVACDKKSYSVNRSHEGPEPKNVVERTALEEGVSGSVIYCLTCTLCTLWKKIYIGETGRRLADRFRQHLRDVEKMPQNQLHAISIFLITPTTTWLFAVYPYTTETQKAVKISKKNLFFNWAHPIHTESMNASHSINLFTNSRYPISTNSKAPPPHINLQQPRFLYSLRRRARNVSFPNLSRWLFELYQLVW